MDGPSTSSRLSPAAWEAADYPDPAAYTAALTPAHLEELEALAATVPPGSPIHAVALTPARRAAAPTLGPLLDGIAAEVRGGRGFALIKGMPVSGPAWDVTLRYWLVGLFWGAPRPNNQAGHLVGHIADTGADPADPHTRLYATSAAQPWHNDSADAVSLLCVGTAAEGGRSAWASSAAIHDALVVEDPAAAAVLAARGIWFYDRKGEVPDGKAGFFEMPVFNYYPDAGGDGDGDGDGSATAAAAAAAAATPATARRVFVNLSSNYYVAAAARFPGQVPPLTPAQLGAVAKVEAMAASPRFALACHLEPGDIQLLNNHTVLHTREAFRDDAAHARHLLRLWLSSPLDPPLPGVYKELYGCEDLTPGDRGGIRVDGVKLKKEDLFVPLTPAG